MMQKSAENLIDLVCFEWSNKRNVGSKITEIKLNSVLNLALNWLSLICN